MTDGTTPRDEPGEAAAFAQVPCLDDLIEMVVRLMPFEPLGAFTFLELGAGSGVLAATLLTHFPNARATLIKESDALHDAARRRLWPAAARVTFHAADFARTDLPRGFQAVVSLLRLHPVEDIARRALYRSVYGALDPDGVFVIADRVRPPTARLADLYARLGPATTGTRLSLFTDLPWLGTVGFRDVDVHYKNLDFAVFGWRRPQATDFSFREDRASFHS